MKIRTKNRSVAYRAVFLVALMVLSTAVMGVGTVAATSETPIVDASAGVTTYTVGGTGVVVDPAIVVTDPAGGTFDGARVVIQNLKAGDELAFTAQGGIAGSYEGSSGILSLSGTATAAEYQAVFRSVTYSSSAPSPDLSDRQITFSIGTAIPFDGNGHFYEYVAAGGISWHDARAAASASSYLGLQGYLVTVTSQAENDFVAEKLQGSGWIGASDDTAFPYISKDASGNDKWYWVTGPEAGTHFWTGGADSAESVNEPASGQYANWQPGEPNDFFKSNGPDNENYAHFYAWGVWNDFPGGWNVDGYVVEYGGFAGESEITWQDIKSVAVTEPPANVAPSISADADSVAADEGSTATNGGSVSDDDGDAVTLSASVGAVVDDGDGTWTWSFDAIDGPASGTVTITATDDDQASSSVSFDYTVDNVAPVLSADVGDYGVAGSPVSASGTFSDAGIADTHSVTVDWGDGTSSSASVTQGAGSGSFAGSHAYATGGLYDVTVTVTDDNGGVDVYTESITVAHLATIDVKPDSSENPVNPKAKGVLPVAIINDGSFDLTQVDVSTLRLSATEGGAGAAAAHGGHLEDVDGDGDLDLMLHFVNQDIGLTGETTAVYLSGFMTDGVPVVGSDMVDPVPVGSGDDDDVAGANGNGKGKSKGR